MPQKRSVEPGDGGDPPTQYLISISAVFCLIAGFILGSSFGSHLLQDFIDGFYGYRWNYLERCIIDDGTFAGGYCRYIQSQQRFCSGGCLSVVLISGHPKSAHVAMLTKLMTLTSPR